jgi:DNA-binding transcriptional MocR family regulator
MIEMQYNFPLLPTQGELWQSRLSSAVANLHPSDPTELRPTFRAAAETRAAHRATAAAWLHSDPALTHITCGTHHGTLLSLLAAGLAGRPIAVETITYTAILEQARMLASPLVACAFDEQGITPSALSAACETASASGRPIAALYTMPSVHNPLGACASLERRQAIVDVARAHDLLLIEDDAYGYMQPDPPPTYLALAPERTFYVRGLSKSFAPAIFTGFLVAPARFTSAIETALKNSSTGTSLPHNEAALSLIADGTLDRIMALKRAEGTSRNAAARAAFAAAGLAHLCTPGIPTAWHLWITLPTNAAGHSVTTPQAFEALMATRGVLLSGGNWFLANADLPSTDPTPANAFRLALGGELDPARTLEGVRLTVQALAELTRSET